VLPPETGSRRRDRLVALVTARRYVILLLVGLASFLPEHFIIGNRATDWVYIEYAARSIVHLNHHYPAGFGVYASRPMIQIGPPPIFLVAAVQWLPPALVTFGFGLLMVGLGVATVAACEGLARQLFGAGDVQQPNRSQTTLLAGIAIMTAWGFYAARFPHLDDALALWLTVAAMGVIARAKPNAWWLAAVLIGLAVASKPWALGAAPVLGALPRQRRSHSVLLMLAVVGASYAPFVLADHATVSALSGFRLALYPSSTLHLLGVPLGEAPGWVRNAQIGLALLIGFALLRSGRWWLIPLAAFSIRVVLDPQVWGYYALGPMTGALIVDLRRGSRLPWLTLVTGAVEILGPELWLGGSGYLRLVWFLVVAALIVRESRSEPLHLGLPPWRRRMTSRTA
jgi:hypothetical protein